MLIVSRKNSESLLLCPQEGIDPHLKLRDLFANGPIEITIFTSSENRVTIGVQAPRQLTIWRKDAEAA